MSSLGHPGPHDAARAAPWGASGLAPEDGWLGTRELPGYRAGTVIVKLADLPGLADDHLYLDVLRIGDSGRIEDNFSGPCPAMRRDQPLDARSRFVRVVAELLRHAPDARRGLAGLGTAIALLRDNGIEGPQLAIAAQQLDALCSEDALAASLTHMLVLSLGEDEASATLAALLGQLLPNTRCDGALDQQVLLLVRATGRVQARRRLREATDFELLPTPELLGL